MSQISGDVLLVGSIPSASTEDVFRMCAERVGDRVFSMPDGELGLRQVWVGALPHMTYEKCPDLEPINLVAPEDVINPDHHSDEMFDMLGTFKLKPGVTKTKFDLHFGHEAVKTYQVFKKLREEGVIDKDVRYQVGLPFICDGLDIFFPERADYPIVKEAYIEATKDTIALLLENIPAEDLAIQFDYCLEVLYCIGAFPSFLVDEPDPTPEQRFEAVTATDFLTSMSKTIPDEVALGYHLCFGTWGGWPMAKVLDIDLIVRLANAIVAKTPHRVDYLHLPGMPNPPKDFFKPLENLKIGDTRVFLGLEIGDGIDALLDRAAQAREYLPDFGIAHYCGYGRVEPAEVPAMLSTLAQGADQISNKA